MFTTALLLWFCTKCQASYIRAHIRGNRNSSRYIIKNHWLGVRLSYFLLHAHRTSSDGTGGKSRSANPWPDRDAYGSQYKLNALWSASFWPHDTLRYDTEP
ncbi:hypothetical protein F5887DRAFT_475789 [Amanita rubescens]|nr:hypothetical protein F5887DRAFT_475789 [Amanita rubescens]